MKVWNFADLKKELEQNKSLKAWRLHKDNVRRLERYFLTQEGRLAIDQDRDVTNEEFSIGIYVTKEGGRQGEITKRIDPIRDLRTQLHEAIDQAKNSDYEAWTLADPPVKNAPKLLSFDPRVLEDMGGVMKELSAKIEKTVSTEKRATFHSAELFVSLHKRSTTLSNGFSFEHTASRIYAEAAYSSSSAKVSDEYLNTRSSVTVEDLDLEGLFAEAARNSVDIIQTKKPPSGRYPVLLHADALNEIFNAYLSWIHSSSVYYKFPFLKVGAPFIPEARGDKLRVSLNPELAYGAVTQAFSGDGVLQERQDLVVDNIIVSNVTDKRHSDYLKVPVTASLGNVEIGAGTLSKEDILKLNPKTLEIVQFSGLFLDSISATFSSEIRLAKLYDRDSGRVEYIKGGSLSATVLENFSDLRLSKNRVSDSKFSYGGQSSGYFGPDLMLLNDVSVVG